MRRRPLRLRQPARASARSGCGCTPASTTMIPAWLSSSTSDSSADEAGGVQRRHVLQVEHDHAHVRRSTAPQRRHRLLAAPKKSGPAIS